MPSPIESILAGPPAQAQTPSFTPAPIPEMRDPLSALSIPPNVTPSEANSLLNIALTLRRTEMESRAAAVRYQGMMEYQQALKAGLPPDEALRVTAPKMFYRHPEGMVGAIRAMTPRPAAPAIPQPRMTNFGGQDFVVTTDRFGQQHVQPIRVPAIKPVTATPEEKLVGTLKTQRARELDKQMFFLEEQMANPSKITLEPGETIGAAVGRIRMRRDELQDQLSRMTAKPATNAPAVLAPPAAVPIPPMPAPATAPMPPTVASNMMTQYPGIPLARQVAPAKVRVRRKSDGKEFLYGGSSADVPKDKYDVVE